MNQRQYLPFLEVATLVHGTALCLYLSAPWYSLQNNPYSVNIKTKLTTNIKTKLTTNRYSYLHVVLFNLIAKKHHTTYM